MFPNQREVSRKGTIIALVLGRRQCCWLILYVVIVVCITLQVQPGKAQQTRLLVGDAGKDDILSLRERSHAGWLGTSTGRWSSSPYRVDLWAGDAPKFGHPGRQGEKLPLVNRATFNRVWVMSFGLWLDQGRVISKNLMSDTLIC